MTGGWFTPSKNSGFLYSQELLFSNASTDLLDVPAAAWRSVPQNCSKAPMGKLIIGRMPDGVIAKTRRLLYNHVG